MFDIRDHGGNFGGSRYGVGKYIPYKKIEGLVGPPIIKYTNPATYSLSSTYYANVFFKCSDGYYAFYYGFSNANYDVAARLYKLDDKFKLISQNNNVYQNQKFSYVLQIDDNDFLCITTAGQILRIKKTGELVYMNTSTQMPGITMRSLRGVYYSEYMDKWYKLYDGFLVEIDINTGAEIALQTIEGNWQAEYNSGVMSRHGRYFWYKRNNYYKLICLDLSTMTSKNFNFNSACTYNTQFVYHDELRDIIYLSDTLRKYVQRYELATIFDNPVGTIPANYVAQLYDNNTPYNLNYLMDETGEEKVFIGWASYIKYYTKDLVLIESLPSSDFNWLFGGMPCPQRMVKGLNGASAGFDRNVQFDKNGNFKYIHNTNDYISDVLNNVKILN